MAVINQPIKKLTEMKKIMILLLLLLPAMAMAQQVVEVNVSALSEEGSNERVGVVLKKDAETELCRQHRNQHPQARNA